MLAGWLPDALRIACSRLGNAADADDAVQEACRDALAALYRIRGGSPRAWFMTLVINRCRKHQRGEGRRAVYERAAPAAHPGPTTCPDLGEAVRAAISELPEHERDPVEMRYLAGLDFPAIAAALGRGEKTVRSQVDRGLSRLRTIVTRMGLAGTSTAAIVLAITSIPAPVPAAEVHEAALAEPAPIPTGTSMSVRWPAALAACLALLLGLWWLHATGSAAAGLALSKPGLATPTGDPGVLRALVAHVVLDLRRDTLTEVLQRIAAQLPADAQVRWCVPKGLATTDLLDGTCSGPLRDVLADFTARHHLAWEARGPVVLFSRSMPAPIADRIRAANSDPRQALAAADQVIASGDLSLRRDLLRLVAHPDPGVAAAARMAAHSIADEGTAVAWLGDVEAGVAVLSWLDQASADRQVWSLLVDLAPPGCFDRILAHYDRAVRAGDGSIAALALAAAARLAPPGQPSGVLRRLEDCHDLDVAIEALCILATRGEPAAILSCRRLAQEIDRMRWTRRTDRESDGALEQLRGRAWLGLPLNWWQHDTRFGKQGDGVELSGLPYDPFYQEPAISALVAIRDPATLAMLRSWAAPPADSGAWRPDGMEAQALAWLVEAGEMADPARLVNLALTRSPGPQDQAGIVRILLRGLRAGMLAMPTDRRRLADAILVLVHAAGQQSSQDGDYDDKQDLLAGLHGWDEPAVIAALRDELAENRCDRLQAEIGRPDGTKLASYGYPLYRACAQALAVMRTPAALASLRATPPQWRSQPWIGTLFWCQALGYARDPASAATLRARADAGEWMAVCGLAGLRDAELLHPSDLRPRDDRFAAAYLQLALFQEASVWNPALVTGFLAANLGHCDADIRGDAIELLGRLRGIEPRNAAVLDAIRGAIRHLGSVAHGPDEHLKQLALDRLNALGWPESVAHDLHLVLEFGKR